MSLLLLVPLMLAYFEAGTKGCPGLLQSGLAEESTTVVAGELLVSGGVVVCLVVGGCHEPESTRCELLLLPRELEVELRFLCGGTRGEWLLPLLLEVCVLSLEAAVLLV